jgi:Protein of unknown function (DUF1592)/Protein of unknown function (DUF1588)/Protein of unknown function (DUF1595)/Protein of unknown function (DUF1587)
MYRSTLFVVACSALVFAGGCAGRGSQDTLAGSGGNGSGSGTGGNGSGSGGSGSGTGGSGSGSGTGGSNSSGSGGSSQTGTGGDSSQTGTGGANNADGGVIIPPSTLAAPDPCTTNNTPGPRKLWRLTAAEFAASIHSIFNDTANAAPVATVFSDPSTLGFSVDANSLLVQDLNASQLEDNAEAIAAWAASAGKLASFASCASSTSGAPASSCATSFIQAFGKAAFRTTLASSDSRIGTYSSLFMAGSSNSDGAQAVISAMLQSPYFIYRSELGKQSGSAFNLTAYEVASELSYTLTGTGPDSTLLSAADSANSGSLSMSSMIDQQAMRLVASTAASNPTAVMGFMNGWLGLPRLFTTAHDATVYQIAASVQTDMQTESQDLIMEAFNGSGTFGSVLTADHSFLNAELASFYNITGVTGTTFKSVKYGGSITRDPGLLATGTILNGYARPDEDSPTQRGHMIRSRMLCQDISPPPPGLNTTFMPATTTETTRDHFINEHEQGQCAGCHKLMDWIGFSFENYDGWGRYRTTDNTLAVNDSGIIYSDPEGNNDNVTGLSGTGSLSAYLAGSDDVTRCMQRYWTYYVYGSSSWSQDGCTYDSVYNESQSNGFGLKSTLMAILHAPNFTTRTQDQ